jgi:membrane-associated phospholipid phosphatase
VLNGRRRLPWGSVTGATVALVAISFSRLYLNAHWLSDVVGALLGGVAYVAFALLWLESRFRGSYLS